MPLDNIFPPTARPLCDAAAAPVPTDDETAALLDAVQAFCHAEIAARRTRPEHALTAEDFVAIIDAAQACGLLDASSEGFGLWSANENGICRAGFSLRALQRVAEGDAAAAWHLHGVAMANALAGDGAASSPESGDGMAANAGNRAFSCEGTHGLARSALGRWLAGKPAAAGDDELLADTFGPRPRIALLAPVIGQLAALRWRDGGMQLEVHDLVSVTQQRDEFPHGLDGCVAVTWQTAAAPASSRRLGVAQTAFCIALQQLAQVAIARGALQPASLRAHAHAQLRRQGARVIVEHDAVAQLLTEIDSALLTVDALLAQSAARLAAVASPLLTRGPFSGTDVFSEKSAEEKCDPYTEILKHALAVHREAMPLLIRAANAAIQIHGGSGYLRDTGLEHIWRTVNALRVTGGGEAQTALLIAGMNAEGAALAPSGDALSNLALSGNAENHLAGHLPPTHPLSPRRAFRNALRDAPLLHLLAPRETLDPWERDTRSLPTSLAALRRRVRHFALMHCAPIAAQTDREQREGHALTPPLRHLLVQAGREGLLTDILPAPIGHAPLTQFRHALAFQQALRVEELARVDGGLMLFLSAHNLGLCPLLLSGDTRLLRRVVWPAFRQTAAGNPQIFAFAITEPAAGSDAEEGHGACAQSPGVRARRAQRNGQSGWLLRGRKIFISGGDIARYIAVFAALDNEGYDSWTCFLVDTHSAGFSVPRCELKSGMRASGAAEVLFDDCFVPSDAVVGGERNGWALARATLNLSRLPVAAMAVGLAQQAVDIATEFACRETLAGKPLAHFQQVQCTLAQMQAETGAIRQLVWHHARRWRVHQDEAAICKFQATDRAQVVVETAMELMGNAALHHANGIERTLRDVRLTRIFEGTNQINRLAVIEEQQPLLLARIAQYGISPFKA